jgi:uncharacterized protein
VADLPAESNAGERTACVAAHLAFLAHGPLPLLAILIPIGLLVYYQGKSELVVKHAKEALNFQISVLLATAICIALSFMFVGFLLLPILLLGALILPIGAAIEGGAGREYRYPVTIRFVR